MRNITRYTFTNFTHSFYTIFMPFFLIISLIFLVKISSLTAKIQISFLEMFELYLYYLPNILFYTIPISFVTAVANTLTRLSMDNELIALYALGLKSNTLLRPLVYLAVLFSFFLLTLAFIGIPSGKEHTAHFIHGKKTQPSLNLSVGELGQKFDEFYIYVEDKNKSRYTDMVIYNRTKKNEEQFFVSKEGELLNKEGVISLKLYNGYGYTYMKDKLKQAKYETLEVFDTKQAQAYQFKTLTQFWEVKRNKRRANFYLTVGLMPLITLFWIASFTIINPRYDKNNSFLVIFLTLLGGYFVATLLEKWSLPSYDIPVIVALSIAGYLFFQKRVGRYF
jgi:lipopolysaccharide export system permease protein